jgi:hypothetical protein
MLFVVRRKSDVLFIDQKRIVTGINGLTAIDCGAVLFRIACNAL